MYELLWFKLIQADSPEEFQSMYKVVKESWMEDPALAMFVEYFEN